jgi:hypothetical protein
MSAAVRGPRAWCATAAALAAQTGAPIARIEVTSPGGHFVAAIEKSAGQERVPDALARWRVAVYPSRARDGEPSWSAPLRYDADPRRYALSEDGRAFAAVEEAYTQARALVRVASAGGETLEFTASALGLARADVDHAERRWIEGGADACRWRWYETPDGATPFLALALASGSRRWIDCGAREVLPAEPGPRPIAVEPQVDVDAARGLATPYVSRVDVPARIRWGETLEIDVSGEHPTPNWRIVGFETTVRERSIELVPRSEPPRGPQLQVLDSYRTRARIHGLAPGAYSIDVHGREAARLPPATVEVERAPALVELRRRGGILGLDERLRVFPGGIALLESNRLAGGPHAVFADAEQLARVERLLRQCELEPAPAEVAGADLIQATLAWRRDGRDFVLATNEPVPRGAPGELLALLAGLRP